MILVSSHDIVVLSLGQFFTPPPQDIGKCLETVLVVTAWGVSATGVWLIEAWDVAKHSAMHSRGPHKKELSSPNVHSAEVHKNQPCGSSIVYQEIGELFDPT